MLRGELSTAIAMFALLGACASPPLGTANSDSGTAQDKQDAGASDAGGSDAGPTDAGEVPTDAGEVPADAGALPTDAGPARADVPALACTDAIDSVYVTPSGLSTFSSSARGEVVRCAPDSQLDLATVQLEVAAKGITTPMDSAVNLYRIAFRTERGDGSAGVSTARVYLPQAPRALPLPVITIGHPTDGLADGCSPSQDATSNQDLALPWAGLGYAVVVPDYAGLGNEGVQSYLDNRDQGRAVLDGARALRALLDAGVFNNQVLAVGYSQGGGAVLSAQALASTYGAGGDLVGVIAFAPEWPTRMNSFGLVDQLENPGELTIFTGISDDVVEVMRAYGYFYNRVGQADADEPFPSAHRSGFDGAVNSLCEVELGGYLQGVAPHVGDILDPGFQAALLACIQQGEQSSACTEPAKGYFEYLQGNFLTADPAGAPVLFIQGLADVVMPAASEAACNLQKLRADGVTPQVCTDPSGQHTTILSHRMDFALQWGQALLAGQPLPSCDGSGMPTCTP